MVAGNTALCTVGRTGNDLHYRGYDILDIAEEVRVRGDRYLLIHGKLPNRAELGVQAKLMRLRAACRPPCAVARAAAGRQRIRWT